MKNYLSLSRYERNGLLLLITLCFIMLLSPTFYTYFKTPEVVDFSAFEADLKAFRQQVNQDISPAVTSLKLVNFDPNTASEAVLLQLGISPSVVQTLIKYRNKGGRFFTPKDLKKVYGLKEKTYEALLPFIAIEKKQKASASSLAAKAKPISLSKKITLFPFNPNTINQEQLKQLGLPEKTVRIWGNFRKKGGRFYKKEDIAKIYGLSKEMYLSLVPFIKIENKRKKEMEKKKEDVIKDKAIKLVQLDVNQASSEDWQKLKGIGQYRAKVIIEQREKLGGFVNLNQITDIYAIPDSIFQSISSQLILSPPLKKLKINTASQKELSAHPYINYKEAKVIINYRTQHGTFRNPDDLLKLKVLSDKKIKKLSPYFDFD